MNVLCIYAKHPRSITTDLAEELVRQGHNVYVVTLLERKHKKATFLSEESGFKLLSVKVGDLFDSVNKYQKFISMLQLPGALYKAITSYFSDIKFDLIVTHTPYVANASLINKLKKRYACPAMLLLWDFFPQNAVDLGYMRQGLLFRYLKNKERHMLQSFDYINCMSAGNREYLKEHYPFLHSDSMLVNLNWATIESKVDVDRAAMRSTYGYTESDKICVFGGNIGVPQAPHNLVKLVASNPTIKFLFIVRGTEFRRLFSQLEPYNNANVLQFIPREDYEKVVAMCDVGLISLDPRFSFPNFPSKTIEYLKCELPVFAMLDEHAAADYGQLLVHHNIGRFILARDVDQYADTLTQLLFNEEQMKAMKSNCYSFYETHLDVKRAVANILQNF